jgi:hypothetical protein
MRGSIVHKWTGIARKQDSIVLKVQTKRENMRRMVANIGKKYQN